MYNLKVPSFKVKIRSSQKHEMESNLKDKTKKSLFESGGDRMSKSSVGNTKRKQIMHLEEKTNETRIKHYLSLEWSFLYVEEDGTLLIFAKSEGKGKLELMRKTKYSLATTES